MKPEKLRESGSEELENRESDLRQQIFHFRIQKATGQLDKPGKLREARKDLARVLTILSERRREAS